MARSHQSILRDRYLNYALQHIKLLRTHHVTPVFVFDGAPLPAKERVHETRHKCVWCYSMRLVVQLTDGHHCDC